MCTLKQEQRVLPLRSFTDRPPDIKPENILLGLYDEIKLADFGYSVHSSSSQRSTICGTLDYLSPELVNMMLEPGASNENYTKAIDQWSLGILMYELLVGKPPFEAKSGKGTQKKIANRNGEGIKFPVYVSEEAKGLILQVCVDNSRLPNTLNLR